MPTRHRCWTTLCLACAILALAGLVWAQAPKAKPPAAERPSAAKKAPPATVQHGEEVAASNAAPASPEVQAILETKPTTPFELIRAGKLLGELERADLAKRYFKRVLDANLDRDQLASLAEQVGVDSLTAISRQTVLAPEGANLASAVFESIRQQAEDPARIADSIQKLQDPSADVRCRALLDLQKGRSVSAGALLAALADPQRVAEHASIHAALVQLGSDAVRPVQGALESKEVRLLAPAIRVLGDLQDSDNYLYLLGPAFRQDSPPEIRDLAQKALLKQVRKLPTATDAARVLAERARRYLDLKQPLPLDFSGQVTLWTWAGMTPAAQSFHPDPVSRHLAARLARDAYMIDPNDRETRTFYLVALLEHAAYQNGLDKPLPTGNDTLSETVAKFDADALERVLAVAMESEHFPAATAAVQVLARKPQAERLLARGSQPSVLVQASQHADRRLRMAAAEAIVEMRPSGPYPGSSWVLSGLTYLSASDGSRRALVASVRRDDAQRVAGYLGPLGYATDTAASGTELLRLAFASPDYELILVDAGIDRPTLDFLLQRLRNDGRTASLPIGILARPGSLDSARHVARNYRRVEAFSYPYEPTDARWQVEQVTKMAATSIVPAAQRLRQASRALELLVQLSNRPNREGYDLRRAESIVLGALDNPAMTPRAATVLSHVGTASSQRALVELASRRTAPLAARQTAVDNFRQAVEHYGLLLTREQIQLQYDRYNQSADQDVGTQKILGLILDCIEAPTLGKKQVGLDAPRDEARMASLKR